jgi:hypothetical protein
MGVRDNGVGLQGSVVYPYEPAALAYIVNDATANDSDKAFTVPAGKEWRIAFVYAQLVTTATVGNRKMRMEIDDGTNLVWFKEWTPTQAASLTRHYFSGPSLPDDAAFDASGRARMLFEPREIIIPAGWRIRLYDVAAIDAAADDMTVRIAGVERL